VPQRQERRVHLLAVEQRPARLAPSLLAAAVRRRRLRRLERRLDAAVVGDDVVKDRDGSHSLRPIVLLNAAFSAFFF
jgi:hypothetical protein